MSLTVNTEYYGVDYVTSLREFKHIPNVFIVNDKILYNTYTKKILYKFANERHKLVEYDGPRINTYCYFWVDGHLVELIKREESVYDYNTRIGEGDKNPSLIGVKNEVKYLPSFNNDTSFLNHISNKTDTSKEEQDNEGKQEEQQNEQEEQENETLREEMKDLMRQKLNNGIHTNPEIEVTDEPYPIEDENHEYVGYYFELIINKYNPGAAQMLGLSDSFTETRHKVYDPPKMWNAKTAKIGNKLVFYDNANFISKRDLKFYMFSDTVILDLLKAQLSVIKKTVIPIDTVYDRDNMFENLYIDSILDSLPELEKKSFQDPKVVFGDTIILMDALNYYIYDVKKDKYIGEYPVKITNEERSISNDSITRTVNCRPKILHGTTISFQSEHS